METCNTCKGNGFVHQALLGEEGNQEVCCPTCRGLSRCSICAGNGSFILDGLKKECFKCKGTGVYQSTNPEPIPNHYPAIWDLVIEDMKNRDKIGSEKYKTRLQPFNTRNFLQDTYEELMDAQVYIKGAMYEIDDLTKKLAEKEKELTEAKQKIEDLEERINHLEETNK